jgi:hypothetical protein
LYRYGPAPNPNPSAAPNPNPSINKQKNERKTLISNVFDFFMTFLYLKNDVNVFSTFKKEKNKQKKKRGKNLLCWRLEGH